MEDRGLIVLAIGGNSLIRDEAHRTVPDQWALTRETCGHVAALVQAGWRVVVTHGNGPQVGFILRRSELARQELQKTLRRLGPEVPEETRAALETMALSISRKMLHEPIAFLKRRAKEEHGERFVDLTRRMYNLDREKVPSDAHADRKPPKFEETSDDFDVTDASE